MRSTHSDRLENFLGPEKVREISDAMSGWYGPPIAVAGVPGSVFATGDGDFIGSCDIGVAATLIDLAVTARNRLRRAARIASSGNRSQLNAGFASLSDLIMEATLGGKKQQIPVFRSATTTANTPHTYAVNGAAPAAPGGRACDRTTSGRIPHADAISGDNLYFVGADTLCSQIGTLLLYDKLFDVAKNMNSTAAEAVTGVPTRYQNTTKGAPDWAGGNFISFEVGTALAATAHAWTVCSYTDDSGAAANLPVVTGLAGAAVGTMGVSGTAAWYARLEIPHAGLLNITQLQLSTAVATGAVNVFMGHPIAFMPHKAANMVMRHNALTTGFNMTRIFDGACLNFIIPAQPTGGTFNTYTQLQLVSG